MGTTKVRAALPKAVIALVMAFASVAGLSHVQARACGSSQTIRRSKLS